MSSGQREESRALSKFFDWFNRMFERAPRSMCSYAEGSPQGCSGFGGDAAFGIGAGFFAAPAFELLPDETGLRVHHMDLACGSLERTSAAARQVEEILAIRRG